MAAKGAYNDNAVRYYLNQHCRGSRDAARQVLHAVMPTATEEHHSSFNYWLSNKGRQCPASLSIFLLALYLKDSGLSSDSQLRSSPPEDPLVINHNADQLGKMDQITREAYRILTDDKTDRSEIGSRLANLAGGQPVDKIIRLPQYSYHGEISIDICLNIGEAKKMLALNTRWGKHLDKSKTIYPLGYWIGHSRYAVVCSAAGTVFFIACNSIYILARVDGLFDTRSHWYKNEEDPSSSDSSSDSD